MFPGMIAHVTEALSRFDINIAQMNVTREKLEKKPLWLSKSIVEVAKALKNPKILISTMSISLSRRKHVLFYQRIGRAGGSRLRNVAELMIATEYQLTGRERPEVLLMERNLEVMKASVELGLSENKSRSG